MAPASEGLADHNIPPPWVLSTHVKHAVKTPHREVRFGLLQEEVRDEEDEETGTITSHEEIKEVEREKGSIILDEG